MGLLSRLRSVRRPAEQSAGQPATGEAPPPGSPSQPEGDGPVTLADRTEPGGKGSPDTNQAKTEPMSPSDQPDPEGAPSLASMNVGTTDPQAPSRQDAGAGGQARVVAPAGSDTPGPGTSHHATGMQGTTPPGESVDTDVAAGAAAMQAPVTSAGPSGPHGEASSGSGDTGPAPGPGGTPLAGSSEELPVVQGVRQPAKDELDGR
jgi:hypothetical protein